VNWLRVRAVAKRHALVLRRSPHRSFDIIVWPTVDTVLFGSLGVFIARTTATSSATVAPAPAAAAGAAYLLSGLLLFHVIYQVQIGLSTGFLEEIWSRNILNLMTTPVKEIEYIAGVALFGLFKMVIGLGVVTGIAVGFFAFNILDVGWGLIPIFAILMVCGWTISMFVIGLVLRFGQSAEVLAWGILFVVLPLSGAFYPVDALPPVMQPVAQVLPTTHAFAAARDLLAGQPVPWAELGIAALGCMIALAAGMAFVIRMLRVFRQRGFVTRFS
jgi:ABC-2 type transport system permease protein